jgi:transposase
LRFALNHLAEQASFWLKAHVPIEWYERYGARLEAYRFPKTETEREQLAIQIGQDGRQLLSWVYAPETSEAIRQHPAVEILRQVWVQQYYQQDDQITWRALDNVPPSERIIKSPYDPEARFSIQRQTEWLGYKALLTETREEDFPHWITHVETTPATTQDEQVVDPIHQALEAKKLLPKDPLLDRGYLDAQVLTDSPTKYGVDVIGPVKVDTTWQGQAGKGFAVSCFTIDWD